VLGDSACGWGDSLSAVERRNAKNRIIERLTRSSRLIERDPAGFELWSTEHGPFWVISNSNMERFYHMLAEQETGQYHSPPSAIRPGDVVLDCGANYGIFTSEALSRGASMVVAIEPVPQNVVCLQRRFASEIHQGRVVIVSKGVWDREDHLSLELDPASSWGAHVVPRSGVPQSIQLTVPLTTIDKLVAGMGLRRVDFIKMDIEGAEQRALAGARTTLDQFRPRMAICVYHRPDDLRMVPMIVPSVYQRHYGQCADNLTSITREVIHFY
jgi:FkbM family methyltransferase